MLAFTAMQRWLFQEARKASFFCRLLDEVHPGDVFTPFYLLPQTSHITIIEDMMASGLFDHNRIY
jgi:hypothetical protein